MTFQFSISLGDFLIIQAFGGWLYMLAIASWMEFRRES
ncbi:hypothetical protein J2X63_003204 [Agromyces sp. 3263]|nr:hypothetical protein [Agromyces sp. 3263]